MATHKFNPGSVLRKINDIEALFPVNEWKVNGMLIWPFLRTALAYSQNQNPNTRKAAKPRPLHRKIKEYIRIAILVPFEYARFVRQVKHAKRLFVGSITHRVSINNQFINKYFDTPIADFTSKGERSVIFDTGKVFNKKKFYNHQMLFSLWFLFAFLEIRKRVVPKRAATQVSLPKYDEFYQYLLDNLEHTATIKKNFNKASVVSRISVVYERKEFLKNILQNSALEHAYFLCYYSSLLYPLIAACNELGIKTTDIQHGGQGRGHYSYDNWSAAPAEGYTLVPRYFWNWDDNSAAIINDWASKTRFHRALSVGNPWTDAALELYDSEPDYKDYILVNMNEMVAEDFIVEAIQRCKHERKWMLRMHPRTLHNRHVLEAQVKEKQIESYVRIEDSNKVPLPVSLKYCTHFLSKPSGSVIEAVDLGFKPVLIRSHIQYYNHYVDQGKVTRLEEDTCDGLLKYLRETPTARPLSPIGRRERDNKFYKFERLTTES